MRSRFLPYATTPGRLLAQLIDQRYHCRGVDDAIRCCVLHQCQTAISVIIGEADLKSKSARRIADGLAAAGQDSPESPVVGDARSATPSPPQARPALDIAGAGHNLVTTRPSGLR